MPIVELGESQQLPPILIPGTVGKQPFRKEELSELPAGFVAIPGTAQSQEFDPNIGASAFARALVGGIDNPEDRLATARKFYPDAQPAVGFEGNIEFTDPATGKRTLFNPPGLESGDFASIARESAQVAGGIGGATLGVPSGLPGIAGGSMLGTAAGEEVFNLAAQALGMEDARDLARRAKETTLIGVAGLGGAATGATASAGVKGTIRGLVRGGPAGRQEAARSVADLKRFGVSPSVAQATQSAFLDTVESFLSRMPGAAGVIRTKAKEVQAKIAVAIERKTSRVSGLRVLDPEVAGRAVIKGIEDPAIKGISGTGGFVARFKARADGMFRNVEKSMSGEATIENTRAMLDELANQIPDLPALNEIITSPAVRKIAAALPDGTLDIAVLKQLRSAIGRKLISPSLIDDIPRGELKRLYAAVTSDMLIKAKASGPKALRDFERVNRFYAAGLTRIEDFLEPLIRRKVPERVFAALESSARQGPTLVRVLRRSVTDEQWKIIATTVIRRLGRAPPSLQTAAGTEFSLQSFLTNWNRLDKAAKTELFNAPGLRLMRKDLDALARASERARESSQAFFNPSGTAGAGIGQIMIFAQATAIPASLIVGNVKIMVISTLGLVMAAGGGNLSARLMTNPNFVRWLAVATKIKPNGLGAHIGRLGAVAAISDGEDKEAILDYLGLLRASATESEVAEPVNAEAESKKRRDLIQEQIRQRNFSERERLDEARKARFRFTGSQ